jgi:hypothetical protein
VAAPVADALLEQRVERRDQPVLGQGALHDALVGGGGATADPVAALEQLPRMSSGLVREAGSTEWNSHIWSLARDAATL